jgi:hypothetical protein
MDELVCLEAPQNAGRTKKYTGEFFLIMAWPLLNVANIGFGNCPLVRVALDIIGFDNRHCASGFLLPLPFFFHNKPALHLFDEFLKLRGTADEFFLGLLKAVVKDVIEDFGFNIRVAA